MKFLFLYEHLGKGGPDQASGLRDGDYVRESVRGGHPGPVGRQGHQGVLRQTERVPAYRLCQIVRQDSLDFATTFQEQCRAIY